MRSVNNYEFWKSHLNWFIPFISELYPLTKFQLLQYEDILDWSRVAINQFITWDKESSDYFQTRIENAHVVEPRIVGYMDSNDHYIVRNINLISWNPEYHEAIQNNEIVKSKEIWKQIHFGHYKIPNNAEDKLTLLFNKFDCEINYDDNTFERFPIPTKLIEEDFESVDWERLSGYWGLWWSFELLQKFENYWVTEKLIENHTVFNYCLKDDLNDEFIEMVLN
ncbi:hypothetical protein SAMN05444285_12348 [Draconibacterium orientale]|uniref:Uncharacterized protein n=1 Tax=Draconibacterium orientale TaxID=1168034 RepID=X5DNF4_9BACT|nr:hypothetical protein [Draconibacterium orientale]AHW62157.1 hypothetical protein FH5T_16260 [Draconibacterium orientale]SET78647.1 hypothetical protein SAMN05444285_12348 [Draconibacterium orientale]